MTHMWTVGLEGMAETAMHTKQLLLRQMVKDGHISEEVAKRIEEEYAVIWFQPGLLSRIFLGKKEPQPMLVKMAIVPDVVVGE